MISVQKKIMMRPQFMSSEEHSKPGTDLARLLFSGGVR